VRPPGERAGTVSISLWIVRGWWRVLGAIKRLTLEE
jgi:hypothetical protein